MIYLAYIQYICLVSQKPAQFKVYKQWGSVVLTKVWKQDPAKFEPQRHPTTELFEKWGIVEYMDIDIPKDDNDLVKRLICERLTEREYLNQIFYHKTGSPETQFISQLMLQKVRIAAVARILWISMLTLQCRRRNCHFVTVVRERPGTIKFELPCQTLTMKMAMNSSFV